MCQIGFPCRAARPRLSKLRSFCQDFFFFFSPSWQPNTNCLLRDHRGAAYQMASGRCCIRKKRKKTDCWDRGRSRQRTLCGAAIRSGGRRRHARLYAILLSSFNVISLPILTPRRNHSLYSHSVDALIQQNYLVFALSFFFFFLLMHYF